MAKDVITKFKLETTAYDSKLQQAAKNLSDYTKTATQAKEGFNKFTQSNIEAARALGNISTTSTDAKNKTKELVAAFNETVRAYNKLSDEQKQSDFAKALSNSLTTLQQRIRETKQEMRGGGGLFGGGKIDGMLQVFGGNVMTKIASIGVNLASELGDAVKQGIELAKQGEGVRRAFERLGRGDILDGLREATHGTVTDLELMKAAVKFNDFRLPVEELGTMLAFAQQKAKDTGQSVDYMVDSIVTGLGRKSLMILDNLGLSAAEIKEEMKKTGDMTSAVGEIIRRQMKNAGDYVETAADRAAQANVAMQNKMEELGRKFGPVEEASNQLWTSMKIGILDVVGGPLAELLNGLTEAGRLQNSINELNGEGNDTLSGRRLRTLRQYSGSTGLTKQDVYQNTIARYTREEEAALSRVNKLRERYNATLAQSKTDPDGGLKDTLRRLRAKIEKATNDLKAIQISRSEYEQGAKAILNPPKTTTTTTTTTATTTTATTNNTKVALTELQQNQEKINKLTQEYVKLGDVTTETAKKRQGEIQKEIKLLEQRNGLLGLRAEQAQGRLLPRNLPTTTEGISKMTGGGVTEIKSALKTEFKIDEKSLQKFNKSIEKQGKEQKKEGDKEKKALSEGLGELAGGLGQFDQGFKQLGIDLGDGFSSVVSGISGVVSILTAISTILSAIEAISAADAIIPFKNGGIVPHAANGYYIPGNNYSGDVTPIMANAGELVLNKAAQGNLASQLTGAGIQNIRLEARVTGEQILLASNNRGRRTGRGEIVQSNRYR